MLAGISYPPIPIFDVGPLALSLHGLFAGIGFVVGAMLMLREASRRGYDADKIGSVLTWALVGAILGARFFTVPAHLGDPGYGFDDAISIAGDYSILGGYAGGILVGAWRMRMLRLQVPATLDLAAAGLAVGAVIGRIGDLAIVEHLGSPTNFFLGYTIEAGNPEVSPQHRILQDLCDVEGICGTFHHTALYDMIGAAILLGVIVWLRRAWTSRHYGQLFAFWVIWYGLQRFVIDFTRLGAARDGWVLEDGRVIPDIIADSVMGPFTGSQWGALGGAAIGVLLLLWWRRNPVVSAEQDALYQAQTAGEPAAADPGTPATTTGHDSDDGDAVGEEADVQPDAGRS